MLTDKRPQKVSDYQAEMMEGELVIFHPTDTKVLHSNPSAALIWNLCDGQHTVGEIIQIIAEAYPESAEQIKNDVPETIQLFVENKAIVLK